jgi:hypothetical protein
MSTKTFGIYTSAGDDGIRNNDELIIEIGFSHIACVIKKRAKNAVAAFELFTHTKDEILDFEELFSSILVASKLLNRSFLNTHVYINTEFALLVPVFKFNKEVAADYLNVVFGEDADARKQFEHVDSSPDFMNVFRVPEKWLTTLNHHLLMVSVHHSYTSIIRGILANTANHSSAFIKVQFYTTHIIVVVLQKGELQFIQRFNYQSTDDVLYYLLNTVQRLNINNADLHMQISGMIDIQSGLYEQLVKYFNSVVVENPDDNNFLIDVGQHPAHYFTPFVNLLA